MKLNSFGQKSKKCRFCKREEKETTFNSKSHLIPELLGSNDYINEDECDICNSHFSRFEAHLAIYFRPHLSLLGVKGKNKSPKFQSRSNDDKNDSRLLMENINGMVNLHLYEGENDVIIDQENQTLQIHFKNPGYRPLWVYKALVKIGLGMLPDRLLFDHEQTFKWLLEDYGDCLFDPLIFTSSLVKKRFVCPFAELYEAKSERLDNSQIPQYILMLYFANQVIQVVLPFGQKFERSNDFSKKIVVDLFPSPILDGDLKGIKQINPVILSGAELVCTDHIMEFTFQSAEFKRQDDK